MIDYRVELALALDRAIEMRTNDTAIFLGSVIDNLAYHYTNYEDFTRSGVVDEGMDTRFYLTAATLYAIVVDSLEADIFGYLPLPEDNATANYDARVDGFYREIFGYFNLSYLTLDPDIDTSVGQLSDEIKRLQKEAHGQGRDNQEPRTEDA